MTTDEAIELWLASERQLTLLREEMSRLRAIVSGLVDHVAAQAELLARRAEK